MRIIGHRGASGLELENTLASLRLAVALGVDGVEFDVRVSKDRQLVLCHDKNLSRISESKAKVADLTLAELKRIPLKGGEVIATLDEALVVLKDTWALIEAKDGGIAAELLQAIDNAPGQQITVTTFNHQLGAELEELRPRLSVYLAEHFKPVEILHFIRRAKADGLTLNAWLLNPLTYHMAQHRGLKLMVYTVNWPFRAWFIKRFYPDVAMCTDHPERFIKRERARSK